MEIYFDNAATTKPFPEVAKEVFDVSLSDYGNPSSKHMKGVDAEKHIKNTKEILSRILKCKENEIIFTSGATESNNMAIKGAVKARERYGKHIITTSVEHASVREPFLELEKQGYDVTFLPTDSFGKVDLESLKESLREDTVFVSVMYVNNETGIIQPVSEIGEILKTYNSDIIFHVDAVQAFGKMRVIPKNIKADLLSVSAHKFHGPKGVGFLYVRDGVRVLPMIEGGGQQKGMRSGTENVPGIAGLGKAVDIIYSGDLDLRISHLKDLREWFLTGISGLEGITVNGGDGDDQAPHIVSVTVSGIRSEVLLHAMEDKGIYISSGSACSSNKPGLSFALTAMGLSKEEAESTVRFSFSYESTKDEIDMSIKALKELVPVLRQFVRK